MVDEFQSSLQKVLVHEGGFSNHPKDPGCATMKGVTQRVYDEYRRSVGAPTWSVKNISSIELQAIYPSKILDGDAARCFLGQRQRRPGRSDH